MRKKLYYIAFFTLCSTLLLSGCKKHNNTKPGPSSSSNYSGIGTGTSTLPTTTTMDNPPTVHLTDLTVTAGSEIDYTSAIESVENMDLSKTMIYVNSASVDRFTPGVYTAYYTFDYMGYKIENFITVTILEADEETTVPPDTSTETTAPAEVAASTDSTSSAGVQPTDSSDSTVSAGSSETMATTAAPHNNTLDATIYDPNATIPDAIFTLSNGQTITIKNTPARYIVETFTDETYYTQGGENYLNSQLKILLNTGEVQVIETVVTRVNGQSETASD